MKTLPNYYLMKEVESEIGKGNSVKIRLVGNSMLPFLHEEKDLLTISPFSLKELKRGDIVLANSYDQYYLHRIISLNNDTIQLCGDAICDSFENIQIDRIIGILRSVERNRHIIKCNALHWKIKGIVWMWLFPIRSYLLIIYNCIKKIKRINS